MITKSQQLLEHRCSFKKYYICVLGIRYKPLPGFKPGDCPSPHELDRDDLLFCGQCYYCKKATGGLESEYEGA